MSRHRHPLSRRSTLAAVAAVCLACSGCVAAEPTLPSWPTPLKNPGSDLPAGSKLAKPYPAGLPPISAREPLGALRPDDRPVGSRVPQIIERGRLIVGVAQSLNRLGFRDPITGELAGFEVDLAREVARDIFNDPTKIEFRYVESRQREEALRNGDVDIVVRTMSITRDRQKTVEFSLPYLQVHPRLLVLRGSGISSIADLENSTVCVTQDSTSAQTVQNLKVAWLLQTLTWSECLMAMQRHQVDAIYSDDAILSGLQAQDPNTELVGDSADSGYYAVATAPPGAPRDTAGLAMQVNATIERIRADGTWDRLYRQWMQQYLGSPGALPMRYRTDQQSAELLEERKAGEQ
ncbi:glutamate ABC transporter substrate-binding protein [Corynebacterium heidelbergense]|uniref:Amino acid ABC transporter substrate-binding protein n=1 Tax=Corynebacterium heidelbergense TaxID=2055947 RepID=A0A364VC45_9CORY|nr:glutamate ABC transporter substrate-binding protein [Corynebacterium heidelbergense]RAV34190.1 amino acid ABC transporter substrate-binding protein [Corynebacterium heidelbergense]WCZ35847.1 ABC transporter glutamine-binding protein GlnH precursor [Corynebacterium heidelbergense]